MATRSTIALEYADGTVGQVYCHWDGYLAHNGEILRTHYMDPFKVRELLNLGDLSALAEDIGTKHSFEDKVPNQCTFYGRDRGETEVGQMMYPDLQTYLSESRREEYDYLLRRVEGKPTWFVRTPTYDQVWVQLDMAIDTHKMN